MNAKERPVSVNVPFLFLRNEASDFLDSLRGSIGHDASDEFGNRPLRKELKGKDKHHANSTISFPRFRSEINFDSISLGIECGERFESPPTGN